MFTDSVTHRRAALEQYLARVLTPGVQIESITRLSGGAIQENYLLILRPCNGLHPTRRQLVLRCDAASRLSESHSRAHEFALLQAAHRAGVCVPEPLFLGADDHVLHRPFIIMEFKPGLAAPHRLVKDDALVPDRDALAYELGVHMARIHGIPTQTPELQFLETLQVKPAQAFVSAYRRALDGLPMAQPAFELGLRWCERQARTSSRRTLVHRDFRTGNYLVHNGKLSAVLDWEFARFGDPHEDIGWLFAQCWRFGAHGRRAGGIGNAKAFLAGYAAESGVTPDADAIHFWEVAAHIRWGIISVQQAERHVSGQQHSLELALTGRMTSELAHTMLHLVSEASA